MKRRIGKPVKEASESHVVTLPCTPPTPDENELARVAREMDKGRGPVEENEELIEAIQEEVRSHRVGNQRRK